MKLADADPHHTNCFLFHPWICFKMLEESICFALFSKHNVSKQQINFSMIKQLCICLVNRQTWHSQWWLIQFSDYHKIVKSLGKAESNVEELLSRCSSLGFTEHSCRYAIPYNFVDEIIFVFVVLNEAFHLTLYLTSIFFFLKNGTEALERPCRIFTLTPAFHIYCEASPGADDPYSSKKCSSEDSQSICRSFCLFNAYAERPDI